MIEYGHSPYNYPEDYKFYYDGGILKIPYIFYGGSVNSEIGLLVLIDGIVQPYSKGGSEETSYDYMEIFNIGKNFEEIYALNIFPTIGKKGDTLKISFVCVEFPALGAWDEAKLSLQNISTSFLWRLAYRENISDLTPLNKTPQITITSNALEVYNGENTELESSLEISDTRNDNSKMIKFVAYNGEKAGRYRTTIFANNAPLFIENNCNYIDYKLESNERVIYEFQLNNDLGNPSIFYAISIDLENLINIEKPKTEAFKTNSILFKLPHNRLS